MQQRMSGSSPSIGLNPTNNSRRVAVNHQPICSKDESRISNTSPRSLQLYPWNRGPKKMAASQCHQSRVRASDDEARSSIATHHVAIKIDLKESQRWGLLGNKHPPAASCFHQLVSGYCGFYNKSCHIIASSSRSFNLNCTSLLFFASIF